MKIRVAVLVVLAIVAVAASSTAAQSTTRRALTVAAAADLQVALPELVRAFEREAGAAVTVAFGSSGNFFAQIQNGAPYDVYLSADMDYPKQLIASGHAEADSLFRYATGRIVLWTRNGSGVDVGTGLRGLTDSRVTRIAIANPKFAPYGRAAEAALRHEKVYDAVRRKLVLGENVAQTAQLVESGNASVGIIGLSLAISPALRGRGSYSEISTNAHPPIDQAAVIVTASPRKPLARQFLAYLKRPEVTDHFNRLGFTAQPLR